MDADTLEKVIASLPDFSEGELQHTEVNFRQMQGLISKHEDILWLDSMPGQPIYCLLGKLWKITCSDKHWQIEWQDGNISSYPRARNEIAWFTNKVESNWLSRQRPECLLGIYLSYEAGWDWESRKRDAPPTDLPDFTLFCPKAIVKKNEKGALTLISPNDSPIDMSGITSAEPCRDYAKGAQITASIDKETYLTRARKIKDEIRSGNSFQVNLSQEFQATGNIDHHAWARLAFAEEPASFKAYYKTPDFQIISLSPERLIKKYQSGKLITRPIAGTLPKRNHTDNPQLLEAFKNDFKELAEHNMLIDLERNDLGKVSKSGSVDVHEYLTVEELPHLYHLVSEISGLCSEEYGSGSIIKALFPGGTITGCPKLETMHILDRLEAQPREAYTGSIGYLSAEGELDLNILIRTATIHNECCRMRFGGGLVWDSDIEKEYLETLAKAKGLIKSLIKGGAEFDPDHRSLRQFFI